MKSNFGHNHHQSANNKGTERDRRQRMSPLLAVLLTILPILTFFAGRLSLKAAPRQRPRGTDSAEPSLPSFAMSRPGYDLPPPLPLPTFIVPDAPDAGTSTPWRRPADPIATSKYLLNVLFMNLKSAPHYGKNFPEAPAAETQEFLRGMIHALKATAPDLSDAVKSTIQDQLCGNKYPDDDLVMYAFLMQDMPEVATGEAIDCILAGREKEDSVTAFTIAAWKASGLEMTDRIKYLADSGQEETKRLFLPDDVRREQDRKMTEEALARKHATEVTGKN